MLDADAHRHGLGPGAEPPRRDCAGTWTVFGESVCPFSTESNSTERVLEGGRRAVEGGIYETLDEKAAVVTDVLRPIDADPSRVCSLAGWNWTDAAIEQLPLADAAESSGIGITITLLRHSGRFLVTDVQQKRADY